MMKYIVLAFACFLTWSSHFAFAQIPSVIQNDTLSDQDAVKVIKVDPLGRGTPQGTIKGILDSFARNDLEQAAKGSVRLKSQN